METNNNTQTVTIGQYDIEASKVNGHTNVMVRGDLLSFPGYLHNGVVVWTDGKPSSDAVIKRATTLAADVAAYVQAPGYTPVADGIETPQSMTRVSLSLARCSAKISSRNGRTCHIDSTDGRRATYTDGKLVRRMSARQVGRDGCYAN